MKSILSPAIETASDSRIAFGIRLKELRLSRGLSQAELAAQLHLSSTTINRYEHGLREPSLDSLRAVAEFFGVDYNYLLIYPNDPPQQGSASLISKFNSLDDRGKSTVLSALEHEYSLLRTK